MDINIFKNLIENSNEGYILINNKGKFLYSNRIINQLVGFKKNELENMYFKEIIHPNNWEELNANLRESNKKKGKTKKFESFLLKNNNINIPIEVNVQNIEWKGDSLYLITIRDITKSYDAADKLKIDYDKIISPKYELSKEDIGILINKAELQRLLDDFYKLTRVGVGVMDMKGNVLAVTAWQDICIKFHRVHPETFKNCTESDTYFIQDVTPGKFSLYKCKNNMWDIATPIMVGKKRVGTLFVGQFFFKEEEIDYELFEKQAEKYCFNKESYLEALNKVPRWSKEKINNVVEFLTKFASMISELSYSNLILNDLLWEQEKIKNSLNNQKRELKNALDRSDFYKDLLVHDIANVFHSLELSLNLMEIKKDVEKGRNELNEIIEIIRMNITKGSSLVSRIRQISNLGMEYDSHKEVNLKALINNAITNTKLQLNDIKLEIFRDFPEEEIIVGGDYLLQDAFENILKNAIIHNNNEIRKIWIRIAKILHEDSSWIKIEFMDNGKGIEDKKKKKIFERGFAHDMSRRDGNRTLSCKIHN